MNRSQARLAVMVVLSATALACGGDYAVRVTDGTVRVSRDFWRTMQNPEPFADNFEARSKRPGEEFFQQLTIYKSPMRDEEQGELELSPRVSIDVFVVHPPNVTVQVRVGHRGHWALSRQTFAPRTGITPANLGRFLDTELAQSLARIYEDEIRRTQSILEALTAAPVAH